MSDQVVYQDTYISISYYPDEQYVLADWVGYQTKLTVLEGCERIMETMQHFECSKVLNDNTHVEGIWSSAAEWVGTDWFPRMRLAGMKRFAWVYSPSMFSRLSTDKSLRFTYDTCGIEVFERMDDAKKWLIGVPA